MTDPTAKALAATPAYDPDNPFAKILSGEWPSHKLFETDRTLAILDIMPQAEGHCVVLPKAPSRNLLDIAPDDLAAVHLSVQKLGRAVMLAFDADGLTVQQFSEAAGGQSVFHTHVHVIPRHEGVPLGAHAGEAADQDMLLKTAAKIRAALDGS